MLQDPDTLAQPPLPDLPPDSFIGPASLEGTAILAIAIDDHALVDHRSLCIAWEQLSAVSVEAAIAGRLGIFDFADDHSLLCAAILAPIIVNLSPEVDIKQYPLPHYTTGFPSDYTRLQLPPDPLTFYQAFDDAYEHFRKFNSQPISPPRANDNESEEDSHADVAEAPSNPHALSVMTWKTVGVVYVSASAIPGEVHLGVSVLPVYRGRGIGLKACATAVQWSIGTIGAHRVQARIMSSPHADRAQRLFTTLGFAHEGMQRRIVKDVEGAWVSVTSMGMLDTDWLVRRQLRAAPRSLWDELLARHQREREELLRWEEHKGQMGLRRTSSTETIRMRIEPDFDLFASSEPESESDSSASSQCGSTRSPSPSPSVGSSASFFSVPPSQPRHGFDERALGESSQGSDAGDPFSDSEWVWNSPRFGVSRSSEEPLSRPLSAASWSSFETVESFASSSSRGQRLAEDCTNMTI